MALARIITRSQACSRELALDLLARGYAVEIVSPDSIPDNIADLELRVDTVLGNQLVASVEAHDGERSASLDFLHHLKAPMVDFMRRPPEPPASAHSPKKPVSFPPGPNLEAEELPVEAPQPAPKAVSPAAEVLLAPELDRKEDAPLIVPSQPLPPVPAEPPSSFAAEPSTIAQPMTPQPTLFEPMTVEPTLVEPKPVETMTVQPSGKLQLPNRPAGWFWGAALAFAIVLLLALVFGFGMRRAGKASTQSSGAAPDEKVAAVSTDVAVSSGATSKRDPQKDQGQVSAQSVSPPAAPAIRSEANSNQAPEQSPVAKPKASTAKPSTPQASTAQASTPQPTTAQASTAQAETTTSHRLGADLIARDTVTYFDQRASSKTALSAKPAKGSARQHQQSRKHEGGVIAANTVTYFDKKPAPKTANRNSQVKPQSDPN